jgi:ubiquinone/menaquinone biosynthesis C-methylase UbiE
MNMSAKKNQTKTTQTKTQPLTLNDTLHRMVQDYYGQELQSSSDLKTSACCCGAASPSPEVQQALTLIPSEILDRFYGCGSPLPPDLSGKTVLDLGCGTGRDVYIASYLVGPTGQVIGVDMTPEQLVVARRYQTQMAAAYGYSTSNVTFLQGYIEDLAALGIATATIDVVISNCVINLSPQKTAIMEEILRVLKPGGQLYFSDTFSDQPIPPDLANDPILRGECLSGALYLPEFEHLMHNLGFQDLTYTEIRALTIDNPSIAARLSNIALSSRTVSALKSFSAQRP